MIIGLGMDLCDIARITRALKNECFLTRIFSQRERDAIAARGEQTAAGYFAAKEAVAKALGTGFRGFMIWDIEITNDGVGCPNVILHNGALERLEKIGGNHILVTITHTANMAAATAVIESI